MFLLSDSEKLPTYIRQWKELELEGETISPRTGHTAISYGNCIYLFGGTDTEHRQNDTYKLDLEAFRITRVSVESNATPRQRSGVKGLRYKDKFIIFGGFQGPRGTYFNDVHEFDFRSESWRELVPNPSEDGDMFLPTERTDHSICLYKDEIIVFGGYNGKEIFNDLLAFNLRTSTWRKIEFAEDNAPHARFGHTAVVFEGAMYVFGGWDSVVTLNSLWKFEFKTNKWTCIFEGNEKIRSADTPKWPIHRYRHTAVVYEHNMVIFGGINHHSRRFNDVCSYNILTGKWSFLKTYGPKAPKRTFHSAVLVEDSMFVLGGFDGRVRLNDLYRVYLGKTEIKPLQLLASDVVRRRYGALKAYPHNFASTFNDGVIWKRDKEGHFRGGIRKRSKVICHL